MSHRVGPALCYYVLTEAAQVESRTSVQVVRDEELKTDGVKARFAKFDDAVSRRLDDSNFEVPNLDPDFLYEEDIPDGIWTPVEPESVKGDIDEDAGIHSREQTYDQYLGAELILLDPGPDGSPRRGTVLSRKRDQDGNLVGLAHGNPYLDSRVYEVDIEGQRHEYVANQIAENLYSQVDANCFSLVLSTIGKTALPSTSQTVYSSLVEVNGDRKSLPKGGSYYSNGEMIQALGYRYPKLRKQIQSKWPSML